MRRSQIVFALAGLSCLAGCSWSQKVEGKVAPDMVSLADRCGSIMTAAMPFAQIDLDNRSSRSPDVRTIIVTVTGTRSDVPKDAGDRDLAAECTFVDNVLTGFRWTKGGPPPPIDSQQTPPGSQIPSGSAAPPTSQPPAAGKAKPFH